MSKSIKSLALFAAMLPASLAFLHAQQISVVIDPTTTRYIEGTTELIRPTYFNTFYNIDLPNVKTQARYDWLVKENRMEWGSIQGVMTKASGTWSYQEDPNRPGFVEQTSLLARHNATRYVPTAEYGNDMGNRIELISHDHHNQHPSFMGQYTRSPADHNLPANLDAAAELYALSLRDGFSDFNRPEWLELINEPHWAYWNDQHFADLHTRTRTAVKALTPQVEVGGPCLAVGQFYGNQYDSFANISNFIDKTNCSLDFYSFHMYDFLRDSDVTPNDIGGRITSGLPLESVLDLIQNYTVNKFGKKVDIGISETGGYGANERVLAEARARIPGEGTFAWEMKRRSISDFNMVNSLFGNMLTYMDHPDTVKKACPFILLEAMAWNPQFYATLYVPNNYTDTNDWVATKMIHFYQMFRDLQGRRVAASSPDPDVQTRAFVDGSTTFVVMNNLSNFPKSVALNIPTPVSMKIRRHGRNADLTPYLTEVEQAPVTSLNLQPREAVVIRAEYGTPIVQQRVLNEISRYGNKVISKLTSTTTTTSFTVNVPNLAQVDHAWLRVGVSRPLEGSPQVNISLNGNPLIVPLEQCAERLTEGGKDYASCKLIRLTPAMLQATNTVTVSFPDGKNGAVGSVVIRAAYNVAPPTLAATNIVDDKGGNPIVAGTAVNYTLTFNEDINAATVSAADFGNEGTSAVNFGAITETSPGVFRVPVTPISAGTLRLRVNAGAVITDVEGIALTTTAAISDDTTLTVTNAAPVWSDNPLNEVNATEDAAYTSTLADNASDNNGHLLTFTKVDGPAWLTVATNGVLSGTPTNSDVGANEFTVSVTDGFSPAVQTELDITVINTNDAPFFTGDPILGGDATEDLAYSGTLVGKATDVDIGAILTYTKVSGPSWLSVAASGVLSGRPSNSDLGENEFTVRVSDGIAPAVQAQLKINVKVDHWGPYSADANTLHLWHLDATAVPAADSVTNDALPLAVLGGGATLGNAGYAGFGTALSTFDGGAGAAIGTGTDAYLAPLALVDGAADNVAWSFADPTTGAFTYEALVRLDFNPLTTQTRTISMMILSGDSDGSGGGARSFQFRLVPKGASPSADGFTTPLAGPALHFISIRNAISGQSENKILLLPTTGTHAVAQGVWFHVAVTYNGNEGVADNLKFYWTKVDPAFNGANLLGNKTLNRDLSTGQVDFAIGQLGRSPSQNNFVGAIDEVRISKVARSEYDFIYGPDTVNDAPVFTTNPIAGANANEDTPYSGTLAGTATDLDANATQTYSKVSGPSWLSVAATGALSGTPTNSDVGVNSFTVSVSDGIAPAVQATLNITVTSQPKITALIPADNTTGVTVGANLVATFSEPIAIGTGTITIRNLTDGTETVITLPNAQVTASGSTLTINPTVDFPGGKDYAVWIGTNAIKGLDENFFGGITNDTTWSFSVMATSTWTYNGTDATNNTWTTVGSWSGGTIAGGSNATANFILDITAARAITLGGDQTIGNITFTDTASSHNLSLTDNTLTFDVTTGAPVIDVTQSDRTLTIDSIIAGNDGLTKTGLGTLAVSGANTFTGATTVSQGALNVLDNTNGLKSSSSLSIAAGAMVNVSGTSAIMAGNWTIAGTLNKTDNTPQWFWNPVALNNGTVSGAADSATYGTYNWAGTTITANGSSNAITAFRLGLQGGNQVNTPLITDELSISSILGANDAAAKAGTLLKRGLGTLTLTGANLYTGTTSVTAGKLFINGNQSTASGNVTISANATLGGTGVVGGNTTIAANGRLEFNLNTTTASHDKLELAPGRTLTFSGASVLTITSSGGSTPGTYTLLTAPGGITGVSPATLNLPPDWVATVSISGNDLVLNVASTGAGDTTAPTLVDIADSTGGSSINENATLNYTVTFSEDMSAASVTSADFGNAGTSAVTFGAITETSPGVFAVAVTPTSAGTLRLQINTGAVITDAAGNALNTTSSIPDNTTIIVNSLNVAPVWASNPIIEVNANEDAAYNATLADNASDANGNPLTFTKISGPEWLSLASNGVLSGTPTNSDVGPNSFTVSVSDGIAPAVQAQLNITVINTNDAPVFAANPIIGANATQNIAYTGTLAGMASDADAGATLTYAKVSGPAWLSITASGALSGTPASSNLGLNDFSVSVSDGIAPAVTAALKITVVAPRNLYSSGAKTWDSTTANWGTVTGGPYNTAIWSTGDNAIFEGTAGTVTLGEVISLKKLDVTKLSSTNKYTIQGGTLAFASGSTINFTQAAPNNDNYVDYCIITSAISGAPNVAITAWANNHFVFAPPSGSSQALGTVSNGMLKLAGSSTGNSLVGTNGKIRMSSGTWTLTGTANAYQHFIEGGNLIISTGSLQNNNNGIALSGGTLHLNNNNAIKDNVAGTALAQDFSITGGILDNSSGSPVTLTNNPGMYWGGTVTFAGSGGANGNLNLGTGRVVLTGTRTLDTQNALSTLTVGGVIANDATPGRGLTKAGAGTLELRGANTYTGPSIVSAGTLLITGSTSASSAVTVNGGNLGGTGTIGGNVTVAAAGNLAPGVTAGNLNISGNLDLSAMAAGAGTLKFGLNALAGTNDRVTVGGSLALGAIALDDFAVTNLGGLQAGTYTLITSTALTGTVSGSTALIATGFNGRLQINGNNLELVVTVGPAAISLPPAAYFTWANGGGTFEADDNSDGVANGIAWLLGAANPSENALNKLPAATHNGPHLRLSFRCLKSTMRGGTSLKIQTSSDCGASDPWANHETEVPDEDTTTVSGVVFDTTDDGDYIQVIADIPTGGAKLFARLSAGIAP